VASATANPTIGKGRLMAVILGYIVDDGERNSDGARAGLEENGR
jgi:hypothetical protein